MRSIIIVSVIILVAAATMLALKVFKPTPEEQDAVILETPVEIAIAERVDFPVQIVSQGLLEAKTLTTAASEVSGKVIEVSSQFEPGGSFRKGDVLVKIDPADYEAALAQAKSVLADAQLALEMEEAKVSQSLRDWKKLGRQAEPSPLVRREPQLASARARLAAAEASVAKASRDLERTVLRAPYGGRILRTHTDVASFLGLGAPMADFYQSKALEVKLPVSLSDLQFLNPTVIGSEVALSTSTGKTWTATVVRQDAEVDRRSRSMHLIAEVTFDSAGDTAMLVPGLFVSARISGRTLKQVFPIERGALVGESELILMREDKTLTKRQVQVVRKESEQVLISSGIEVGDQVCVSYVPIFVEGMKVRLAETPKE